MVRTKEHKAVLLRWRGVIALAAYLVLLFCAHVHVVLEAHEHGVKSGHAEEHEHDSDHDHSPHPADDHSLTATVPCLDKGEQFLVHDLVMVAEFVLAPVERSSPDLGWIEDKPKHPPPRLPEQPRSPPLA